MSKPVEVYKTPEQRVDVIFGIEKMLLSATESGLFNGQGFALFSFAKGKIDAVFDLKSVQKLTDDHMMDVCEAGVQWAHEAISEPWMGFFENGEIVSPKRMMLDEPEVFASYLRSVARLVEFL